MSVRRRFGGVFRCCCSKKGWHSVNYQQVIKTGVSALGYALVDVQFTGGGLLRVTIDWPWDESMAGQPSRSITVDDCEAVSRQLQYALEVDGVDYRRLEVSSPGVDRPLHSEQDFMRFCGCRVHLVLKDAVGSAASGTAIAHNRKKFTGALHRADTGWELHWSDEPKASARVARVSRQGQEKAVQVLGFVFEEVHSARLAPALDFRGQNRKKKRRRRRSNEA